MTDMSHIDPGLCGRCSHARLVINDRGSRFWLCGAAGDAHPDLKRYPPLPVLACAVHSPGNPLRPRDSA